MFLRCISIKILKMKKKINNTAFINIYDNYIVPINSLFYLAESRIHEAFNYILLFELFNILENYYFESFFNYIKKRNNFVLKI